MKYCINCEEPVDTQKSSYDDFCSQECADEYIASCDSSALDIAQSANDNALPVSNVLQLPKNSVNDTVNSADAITNSLLQLSGINQKDINEQLTKLREANVKDKSQNE